MTLILIVLWLVTSVLSYSAMFAYWQREYPYSSEKGYWGDMATSAFAFIPISGPISIWLFLLATNGYRGFKFF